MKENNGGIKLLFEAATIFYNKVLFVCKDFNLICTIDMETNKLAILGSLPEESFYSSRLCGDIIVYGDEIVFVPFMAKKIWILNYKTNKWSGIDIPNENKTYKFWSAELYKDKVYMMGHGTQSILCLDMKEKDIKEIDIRDDIKGSILFGFNTERMDSVVYLPCVSKTTVLAFDLESEGMEYFDLDCNAQGFQGISYNGKEYWLVPREKGSLIKWNKEKGSLEDDSRIVVNDILGVVAENESVIMTTYGADSSVYKMGDNIKQLPAEHTYSYSKKIASQFILLQRQDAHMMIYFRDTKETYHVSTELDREVFNDMLDVFFEGHRLNMGGVVHENIGLHAIDYIDILKLMNKDDDQKLRKEDNIGDIIYNKVV